MGGSCQCLGGAGTACPTDGGLVCVDLQNDTNNCGYCGGTCPTWSSFLCKEGRCVDCPEGTIYCGGLGYCTNPLGDSRNCGGCGQACAKENSYCALGACTCGDRTDCGTVCSDLNSDPDNCGFCAVQCPGGLRLCSGRKCLPCSTLGDGYGECDGACTDLRFDDSNCGTCGTRCGLNKACIQGVCIAGQ